MPLKKKGKGKKTGCKKSKHVDVKNSNSTLDTTEQNQLPIVPPKPREQLINLLTTHHEEENVIHGTKVSSRVMKQLMPQEIRELRMIFDIFDTNNDGYLDARELKKTMCALGFRIRKIEAKRIVTDASLKIKGVIDFSEFLEVVIDRQCDDRDIYEEILQGFAMFDQEKRGVISLENLRQACLVAGVKFTLRELEEMMEEADINGDGVVDQKEFVNVMLQSNLF